MGKPVLVLLNQTGPPRAPDEEADDVARWRDGARARTRMVRGVLALDAFARCWVQEFALFDGDRRRCCRPSGAPAFARLAAAWRARRWAQFDAAMAALAQPVAAAVVRARRRAAARRCCAGSAPRSASRDDTADATTRRRAARRSRATRSTPIMRAAMERADRDPRTRRAARPPKSRRASPSDLAREGPVDEGKAAAVGGIVSGAVTGLAADLAAGGLTFGAGMLTGALLGALGGAGIARARQRRARPDRRRGALGRRVPRAPGRRRRCCAISRWRTTAAGAAITRTASTRRSGAPRVDAAVAARARRVRGGVRAARPAAASRAAARGASRRCWRRRRARCSRISIRTRSRPAHEVSAHGNARRPACGVQFRLRITTGDDIAVGPGKIDLLEAIAATGSITAAAKQLGMSYRRAWLLVDTMNRCFRGPVVDAEAGGQRGGGTALTPLGAEVVAPLSPRRGARRPCGGRGTRGARAPAARANDCARRAVGARPAASTSWITWGEVCSGDRPGASA